MGSRDLGGWHIMKKLRTYGKDETVENIVENIMEELFESEIKVKDDSIVVMDEKEYYKKLGDKSGRELNAIIYAVQNKIPKEKANLKDETEERFFDNLVKQAEEHVKKYGKFPVFELCEID